MMSMRKVLAVLFSLAAGPAFAQGTPAGNSGDFQTNAGSLRFGSATPGTGVASAFQNPINAASGFVTYSGAFGTPTSLNLTNATALPTTSLTGALQAGQFPALTGDITTSAGALATTLATVNGNVGSFGSSTSCPAFTVNAKGLITAASASTCAPAIGSITGLGTGVATALGVAVGSAGAPVINGGALGTPSSGNGTNLTGLVYTALPALSANQILGALTATTPSGQSVPSCSAANNALIWTSGTGFGCNTISAGAISSVSNADGTLTISPTTGAVVASIALGHANTWTNVQTFNSGDLSATAPAFAGTFTGTYTLGGTPSIPASGLTGTALPSGIVSSSLTSVGTLSTGTWQATSVGPQWGGTGQNFSASTGVIQASSGTFSATTTPTMTATNVTGIPPHQISSSLGCTSTTGSSSSTAYTCSTSPSFTPANGDQIFWLPGTNDVANTTTTPTLNVNGTTAYSIVGNGLSNLLPADVGNGAAAQGYQLEYSTAAAVPCSSHCWVLDSGTRNNGLSTATATGGPALDAWYAWLRKVYTTVVGVRIHGDSISSCYQTDPGCSTYGPQYAGNRWPSLLLQAATQAGIPIYGNGIQPCIGTVISAAFELQGPYTSTGTISNGNQVGPSQATGALTGGSICSMSAGATITYPAGHTFYAARFYCGQGSSSATIAVTIGGTSVGNICASTGSASVNEVTFNNPAGTTSAQIVMTATGAGQFYGLELQYTSANYGLVIHNESVGAANSYFFGANTTQNLGFNDLLSGAHALEIWSLGVNDQAGNVSAANYTTNMDYVLNHEQALGSSTLVANEYVWTGTGSTNTSLRPTALTNANSLSNPLPSDYLDFQDVIGPITPAQSYAMGCLQSDLTHESDLCALAMYQMVTQHIFLGRVTPTGAWSFGTNATQGGYTYGYEAFQNSTDANPNFRIQGCFYSSLVTCNVDHGTTPSGNWLWGINGATAQTGIGGDGGVLSIGSYYIAYGAANAQTPTGYPLTIDYSNHLVTRPYNIIPLLSTYTSSGTAGTYTNVSDGTRTMQFALNATEFKNIHCDFTYGASATSVGVEFKWTYSGTMTLFHSRMSYDATTATAGAANMIYAPVVTAVATQQPTTPTTVNTTTAQYEVQLDVDAYTSTAGTLTLTSAPSATGTINFPSGECRAE